MLHLIDKLSSRKWTADDIHNYISNFTSACFGYAADDTIRKNAASGGITTALLKHALNKGSIDGALVCKTVIANGKVRAEYYIAKNSDQLLPSQGSKYVLSDFTSRAIPLLKSFEGKLAVVALPCEISLLNSLRKRNSDLDEKTVFTVSLFCGHTSTPHLIDHLVDKLLSKKGPALESFTFRKGHWRGRLEAVTTAGTVINCPSFFYNQYQNLFFFCPEKCLSCHDHFGYDADICVGDAWLYRMKNEPIKHNSVLAKTDQGEQILRSASAENGIVISPARIEDILDAQSRTLRLHYNITSRAKAARFFNLNVADRVNVRTRAIDDFVAWLLLFNCAWSRSKYSRLIFRLPGPVVKLYLYFIKFLEIW